MHLSIGIVGLPNVGKSTLFKLLTKQEVHIANYPFATIDPNVGVVPVPDERLEELAQMAGIEKKVPAVIEFYDIAGLVKGAHKGEGLGNQFLAHIRETDAIVIVLRAFTNPEVAHMESEINPLHDLEIVNAELIAKDLETVRKRLEKAESEAHSGAKEAIQLRDALFKVERQLDSENLLEDRDESYSNVLKNIRIRELNLLSAKKQIYLVNGKEISDELQLKVQEARGEYIVGDLTSTQALPELVEKAYKVLGLITFFTMVGEREVRAWPIPQGTTALKAAGEIHTDFEKKFIKAEVIQWDKLLAAGSWQLAKQKGLIRLEGREYVVQDGDVMAIRHG